MTEPSGMRTTCAIFSRSLAGRGGVDAVRTPNGRLGGGREGKATDHRKCGDLPLGMIAFVPRSWSVMQAEDAAYSSECKGNHGGGAPATYTM